MKATVKPQITRTGNIGNATKTLEKAIGVLDYEPSDEERIYKAQYWNRKKNSALFPGDEFNPTLPDVMKNVSNPGFVEVRWKNLEFRNWFCDRNEVGDRIEAYAVEAVDCIGSIIRNIEAKDSDKLKAAAFIINMKLERDKKEQVSSGTSGKEFDDLSDDELLHVMEKYHKRLGGSK